jgi:subtilisin family serine protease
MFEAVRRMFCGKRLYFAVIAIALLFSLSLFGAGADAASLVDAQRKVVSEGGYAGLANKANTDGKVRLIINLNQQFTPMGQLQAAEAQSQISSISAAQTDLIDSLAGHNISNVTSFKYTPQMAVIADKAALDALIASSAVSSVEEDVPVPHTLDLSVPRIGAPTVWNTYGYTGAGVYVAILDTGVDKTHPFLTGAVVSEACYSSTGSGTGYTYQSVCPGAVTESTATDSALPYGGACVTGDCDHGTHVSGISSGRDNGSFSGVARGSGIIAIQVFTRFNDYSSCGGTGSHCALSYTSDQVKGLQRVYELRNTYNISSVNMSLGGGRYYASADCDYDSRKASIDTLKSVNIATVISSGNSYYKDSMGAPGCISSAVSVGATTDADAVADYSNSASFLSLLAPGSGINSSIPGGGYASWNGTSMAAPHVTGAWALLKQANPSATVDQILGALQSTGVSITDTNSIAKPRIQVDSAFLALPCHQKPVNKSGTANYYATIQTGYNALTSGQTALMREMEFAEDLVLAAASPASLKGGYDCAFSPSSGFTTVHGKLTITGAAVTIDKVKIR